MKGMKMTFSFQWHEWDTIHITITPYVGKVKSCAAPNYPPDPDYGGPFCAPSDFYNVLKIDKLHENFGYGQWFVTVSATTTTVFDIAVYPETRGMHETLPLESGDPVVGVASYAEPIVFRWQYDYTGAELNSVTEINLDTLSGEIFACWGSEFTLDEECKNGRKLAGPGNFYLPVVTKDMLQHHHHAGPVVRYLAIHGEYSFPTSRFAVTITGPRDAKQLIGTVSLETTCSFEHDSILQTAALHDEARIAFVFISCDNYAPPTAYIKPDAIPTVDDYVNRSVVHGSYYAHLEYDHPPESASHYYMRVVESDPLLIRNFTVHRYDYGTPALEVGDVSIVEYVANNHLTLSWQPAKWHDSSLTYEVEYAAFIAPYYGPNSWTPNQFTTTCAIYNQKMYATAFRPASYYNRTGSRLEQTFVGLAPHAREHSLGYVVNVVARVPEVMVYHPYTKASVAVVPPPNPEDIHVNNNLSGGTIFIIVMLSLFAAYVLFGGVFNMIRGRRGWELFPNFELWKSFFAIVMDGVAFSFCCSTPYARMEDDNIGFKRVVPEVTRQTTSASSSESPEMDLTKGGGGGSYGTI
jgi:hypothetical protein